VDCAGYSPSFDFVEVARIYSNLLALLAGFAFVSITLLLQGAGSHSRPYLQRSLSILFVTFYVLVLLAIMNSIMGGERCHDSTRVAVEGLMISEAFTVAVLLLFLGLAILFLGHSASQPANLAQVGIALGVLIAAVFQSTTALDVWVFHFRLHDVFELDDVDIWLPTLATQLVPLLCALVLYAIGFRLSSAATLPLLGVVVVAVTVAAIAQSFLAEAPDQLSETTIWFIITPIGLVASAIWGALLLMLPLRSTNGDL
jgi:hypothetical protein